MSRIMADAMGRRTGFSAEPSVRLPIEKHQDIRLWLWTCKDFLGGNSGMWADQAQRMSYAQSAMDGKEVTRVGLTHG